MKDAIKYLVLSFAYVFLGVGLKYLLKRYTLNSIRFLDVFWMKLISNALIIIGAIGMVIFGFLIYLLLS